MGRYCRSCWRRRGRRRRRRGLKGLGQVKALVDSENVGMSVDIGSDMGRGKAGYRDC